jgi:hypothetical protein
VFTNNHTLEFDMATVAAVYFHTLEYADYSDSSANRSDHNSSGGGGSRGNISPHVPAAKHSSSSSSVAARRFDELLRRFGAGTSFWRRCILKHPNICQDRLGTDIGKAEKRRTFSAGLLDHVDKAEGGTGLVCGAPDALVDHPPSSLIDVDPAVRGRCSEVSTAEGAPCAVTNALAVQVQQQLAILAGRCARNLAIFAMLFLGR